MTGQDSIKMVRLMSADNGDDVYEDTEHMLDAKGERPCG
jgi:hypothetical protein